ncbi:uncharacterized protein B0H64DRAFT_192120 [Chaetomium fimeti]|uniref:Uncharacterized protein n=1 Tax=Chaetomium fimeti TaxID=1854472 RepID=A0AAE0LRC4_9PEZI|nr:hypothetical protein B0H64DRAFT_192120 [Chaetomium fimeti]
MGLGGRAEAGGHCRGPHMKILEIALSSHDRACQHREGEGRLFCRPTAHTRGGAITSSVNRFLIREGFVERRDKGRGSRVRHNASIFYWWRLHRFAGLAVRPFAGANALFSCAESGHFQRRYISTLNMAVVVSPATWAGGKGFSPHVCLVPNLNFARSTVEKKSIRTCRHRMMCVSGSTHGLCVPLLASGSVETGNRGTTSRIRRRWPRLASNCLMPTCRAWKPRKSPTGF